MKSQSCARESDCGPGVAVRTRARCMELAQGEPLVFFEGQDEAILGLVEAGWAFRVLYDSRAIIRALERDHAMDCDGAAEFFEYNIVGAACPDVGPLFLRRVWGDCSPTRRVATGSDDQFRGVRPHRC